MTRFALFLSLVTLSNCTHNPNQGEFLPFDFPTSKGYVLRSVDVSSQPTLVPENSTLLLVNGKLQLNYCTSLKSDYANSGSPSYFDFSNTV